MQGGALTGEGHRYRRREADQSNLTSTLEWDIRGIEAFFHCKNHIFEKDAMSRDKDSKCRAFLEGVGTAIGIGTPMPPLPVPGPTLLAMGDDFCKVGGYLRGAADSARESLERKGKSR